MRELSVYYCHRCGRYGYYQLTRNAFCPVCNLNMNLLDMRYPDFMRLDLEERQLLLLQKILALDPESPGRILSLMQADCDKETAAALDPHIQELEKENRELNDTIKWMHQTIWDLIRKNNNLEQRLEIYEPEPLSPSD